MLRLLIPAFILTFVSTATVLGQDAAEQALIDYHTARAIDAQCHFLRYFELSVDRDIEPNVLRPLWFTGAHEVGKIDDEEYLAAYNKLADMGEQRAASIDCANEAAAAPYILKLREQISVLIYADLIIAVDGGGLSDERMRAARACVRPRSRRFTARAGRVSPNMPGVRRSIFPAVVSCISWPMPMAQFALS